MFVCLFSILSIFGIQMQTGSHSGPSNVCPKCNNNCFMEEMKKNMPGAINIKGGSTVFNDRTLNVQRQMS